MFSQARNTFDRVAGHFILGAHQKMTPRSIRRAAERQAIKLARKAEKAATSAAAVSPTQPATEPRPVGNGLISEAQLQANRANAQLSTGPTSLDGKATSCLNAVKTGLTGRTVLLHTDDAADYQRHIAAYEKELSPVGQRECDLVQSIADTIWRVRRIPGLEMAIYAHGRVQFADKFKDHDETLRPGMIELETFIAYEKQLRNLQLQEARLSRRREKETAELRELQQARNKKELAALDAAARQCLSTQTDHTERKTNANGFEFSTAETERYLEGVSFASQSPGHEKSRRQAA
jgi:hypothetical protein